MISDRVKALQVAGRSIDKKIDKLRSGRYNILEAIQAEAAKALGVATDEIEGGEVWECEDDKNPTGMCYYDGREDPCWDSCLFCGEPYERK